jgi:hypothetical protein
MSNGKKTLAHLAADLPKPPETSTKPSQSVGLKVDVPHSEYESKGLRSTPSWPLKAQKVSPEYTPHHSIQSVKPEVYKDLADLGSRRDEEGFLPPKDEDKEYDRRAIAHDLAARRLTEHAMAGGAVNMEFPAEGGAVYNHGGKLKFAMPLASPSEEREISPLGAYNQILYHIGKRHGQEMDDLLDDHSDPDQAAHAFVHQTGWASDDNEGARDATYWPDRRSGD